MKRERTAETAKREPKRRPDPTERERAAIEAARIARAARKSPVAVEWSPRKPGIVESPHSDAEGHAVRLEEAFGTRSGDAASVALCLLDHVSRDRGTKGGESTLGLNASLAFVESIAPRDELESALAQQMAGCHMLTMEMLARARHADDMQRLQTFGSLAVKLQRTFAGQIEALARLRGGVKQQVEVRHTYVNENTAADHATGGGGSTENGDRPQAQGLAHLPGAPVAPVRGADQGRDAVPVAGGGRPEAVPDARRAVARAA